jgi:hypothetical protein
MGGYAQDTATGFIPQNRVYDWMNLDQLGIICQWLYGYLPQVVTALWAAAFKL